MRTVAEIMNKYQANQTDHPEAAFNHAFFWAVRQPRGRERKPQRELLTHSGPWTDLEAMRQELATLPGIISVTYNLD